MFPLLDLIFYSTASCNIVNSLSNVADLEKVGELLLAVSELRRFSAKI
jgi:hypothetical protein